MGQCMSRKAASAFAASSAVIDKRPSKKRKIKIQSPDDEIQENVSMMKKNKNNSTSKGISTSFGFKRRPITAPSSLITSSSCNTARRLASSDTIDSNGNDREDDDTKALISNAKPSGRSTPKLPAPKKEGIASQRVSRFGFRQPQINRLNKVADLNADPMQFGDTNDSVLPNSQQNHAVSLQNKYKTSRLPAGGGVDIGTHRAAIDNNRNRTDDVETTTTHINQIGKFILQTTQLPRPQSIRVMETKIAKTLANNNMKMANSTFRKASPDDSSKDGSLTEDSGVGSHNGTDENSSLSPSTAKYKQRNLEILLNGNTFDVRDINESTEVPLPKLPNVFQETSDRVRVFQNTGIVRERMMDYQRNMDKKIQRKLSVTSSEGFSDISCSNEIPETKTQFSTQKSFLKPKPSPVKLFIKSAAIDNKGYSSSASSDEHEWAFGGEAMADEVSFSISSSDESRERDFEKPTSLPDVPRFKRFVSTMPMKTEFQAVNLIITDDNLEAVVDMRNSVMLEDETSPVDSLLSSSESEEISRRQNRKLSDSKDIGEKESSSPLSPGTPTNVSNSLSLSEGKDDFLIDDEIADQPALVFGDKSQHNNSETTTLVESTATPRSRRKKLRNFEGSPLIMKDKRSFRCSTISLDTLSPCESIASDDLMMDYDYSQSSGMEECDKLEKKHEQNTSLNETLTAESEVNTVENFRDWSALLNSSSAKRSSRSRFLRSRTGTPNSISDSPNSLDGKTNTLRTRNSATSSPLRRLTHNSSVGYESDDSTVVKLDRATHAAVKNDLVGVKTMLLKLRRVLNEQTNEDLLLMSETRNLFESHTNGHFQGFSSEGNSEVEEENGRVELAELRRQVLFLQGQLEDKERSVQYLQDQVTKLCVNNYFSNSAPASCVNMDREMCNAATQTERMRPLSVGPTLSHNNPIEPSPGSLVSATERKTRTSTRSRQETRERQRHGVLTQAYFHHQQRVPNLQISTSIPRRSDYRSRATPSSFT